MIKTLKNYISLAIRPFESQRKLAELRSLGLKEGKVIRVPTFYEGIMFAWAMVFIEANVLLICMEQEGYIARLPLWDYFPSEVSASILRALSQSGLFIIGLKTIFFPIFLILYGKMWKLILTFFISIPPGKTESERLEIIDQVVASSFSSYFWQLIPGIGGVIQFFSFALTMLAGMKIGLNLSYLKGALILFVPYFALLAIGLTFVLVILGLFMGVLFI